MREVFCLRGGEFRGVWVRVGKGRGSLGGVGEGSSRGGKGGYGGK